MNLSTALKSKKIRDDNFSYEFKQMLNDEIDQQIKSISAARARRGNPLVTDGARIDMKLRVWRRLMMATPVNMKKLLYLEDIMVYDGFETVVNTWKKQLPKLLQHIDLLVNMNYKEYLRHTFYFGVEIDTNHLDRGFMGAMRRSLRSTAKDMVKQENNTRIRYNRKPLSASQQKAIVSRMYFHVFYNTNVKACQLDELQDLMENDDGEQAIATTWVSVIPSLYDDMHREMKSYIINHITNKKEDSRFSDMVQVQHSINKTPW